MKSSCSKPFFITIDTEGDALWDNPSIENITTENSLFIPRFQELCERYGFIPIWLVDYEMACDDRFVKYIKPKSDAGLCEVGIHVHARNNPPLFKIEGEAETGAAYLIEYPEDIMMEKFLFLKKVLEDKIGKPVITHRAGRWCLNDKYIDILIKTGIKYDCSFTPGVDWSKNVGITPYHFGSDYSKVGLHRQVISTKKGSVIEYPVSIFKTESMIIPYRFTPKNLLRNLYYFQKKKNLWLRPNTSGNYNEMKYMLKRIINGNFEYAELMIHSSELMPGGGPQKQGKKGVEILYKTISKLFKFAYKKGFRGHTFNSWEQTKGINENGKS